MNWLQGGGYLVVHIVDREMFDPILQAANPLLMLTPQRHSPKRITTSKITFDKFKYFADYQLDQNTNSAKFIEKFSNRGIHVVPALNLKKKILPQLELFEKYNCKTIYNIKRIRRR